MKNNQKEFTYNWNLSDLDNVEKNGLTVFSCFSQGSFNIKCSKLSILKH